MVRFRKQKPPTLITVGVLERRLWVDSVMGGLSYRDMSEVGVWLGVLALGALAYIVLKKVYE